MSQETTSDADLHAALMAAETTVWQALASGDEVQDAASLDDTFWGVYPDGFAAKSAHVSQLINGPTINSFALSAARSRRLGDGYALLVYKATFQRVACTAPEEIYVSSIWHNTGQKWINIFSQDTPALA